MLLVATASAATLAAAMHSTATSSQSAFNLTQDTSTPELNLTQHPKHSSIQACKPSSNTSSTQEFNLTQHLSTQARSAQATVPGATFVTTHIAHRQRGNAYSVAFSRALMGDLVTVWVKEERTE